MLLEAPLLLRPYQVKAADAAMKEWEDKQSTLIVIPTGGGKTVTACEIIRRMLPKRAMFLAHREELIFQAKGAIERSLGVAVDVEMADMKANSSLFGTAPVVVSSIQTQCAGKPAARMTKFKPEHFGLIIADEFHHFISPSFKRVLDYYKQNPALKVLALTATPDRLDRKALGQICDSVAFDYEILDAINDGYLVNIEQHLIRVGTLDFSHVRTTAGDLNGADLAAIMEDEKNLQGVCGSSIEIVKDRKTLVFTASVRHAELCSEIFNRHRKGMAAWVCGETPKAERRLTLKDFASGKLQVVANCGVLTEGFDDPSTECIVMARPTKSRSLYAQIIGRALRPLPGVIDELNSTYERKEAILASAKPLATVLDFTGNSGRHRLMTSADILGGHYSAEAQEMALKKAEKANGPVKMKELLEQSEEEIRKRMEAARLAAEARKAKIVAKVRYTSRLVNPFDAFGIEKHKSGTWDSGKVLTDKQRNLLLKIGVDPEQVDYRQAQQIIIKQMDAWKRGLATVKQCATLRKFGYETKDMTFKEASEKLNNLAANNWKRPHLQPA